MASRPLVQVPSTAVDLHGLSVSTAVRSPSDPRPGSVYDNTDIAAAVPVHFHPMTSPSLGGDNFMMLMSQRWHDATPLSNNPGYSSAHTVDSTPSWALVNAANGTVTALNSGFTIPIATTVTNPVLRAAVSKDTNFLYTLISTDQGALVQQWHNNTAINVLQPINEEILPTATNGSDGVIFDAGIDYSATTDPYMFFYGIGTTSGHLYCARKAWSRVGATIQSGRANDGIWEFFNGAGWVHDPLAVQPIDTSIVAAGPLSFSHYSINRAVPGRMAGYTLMAVTKAAGSARSAQVYTSLAGRSWTPLGSPIALGSVGTTYLGPLQLQGHLGANPAMIDGAAAATAIPYIAPIKQTVTSPTAAQQIALSWGLIQVPRHV